MRAEGCILKCSKPLLQCSLACSCLCKVFSLVYDALLLTFCNFLAFKSEFTLSTCISFTGVSIWRYGAENSASKYYLAPRAVFGALDNAEAGNYELLDSHERPCTEVYAARHVLYSLFLSTPSLCRHNIALWAANFGFASRRPTA